MKRVKADKNHVCEYCSNFILKEEEYHMENELKCCNHCHYITKRMVEDGETDFHKFLITNNIHFDRRKI